MKTAIIGSRTFEDWPYAAAFIKNWLYIYPITEIVSGGAAGADHMAELASKQFRIPIKIYEPDWKKYGRSAGMIRNKYIINRCEVAIVFWDYESNGTRDSINKLAKAKKPCFIVNINTNEYESFNFTDF